MQHGTLFVVGAIAVLTAAAMACATACGSSPVGGVPDACTPDASTPDAYVPAPCTGPEWQLFTTVNTASVAGLVDDSVVAIAIDDAGGKWFGTSGGEVIYRCAL